MWAPHTWPLLKEVSRDTKLEGKHNLSISPYNPQFTTKNDHNLLSRPPRPLQPTRLQCTPPKWAASRQSYLWSHGAYIENLTKVSPWLGGLGIGGCWLGILREGRGLWGPLSEGRHTEYVLGVRPEPENFRGAPHHADTTQEGETFFAPPNASLLGTRGVRPNYSDLIRGPMGPLQKYMSTLICTNSVST